MRSTMLGRLGARQADLAMDDVREVGARQRPRLLIFLIVPASAMNFLPPSSPRENR
jgi:hypothetical protein